MIKKDELINWAVELQSIAQNGLEYGHDRFDLERYERIREIASEMMTAKSNLPLEQVKNLFSSEDGYQTPKLGTRAAIFKDKQILLVRETTDGKWSLPGGWCEPNVSVEANCLKEVEEEAGRKVVVKRVIALRNHTHKTRQERIINVCNVFFLCQEVKGNFVKNTETDDCQYFAFNDLPELSEERNSKQELAMCFAANEDANWQTTFE
ncbi:NUDIX hydrolase N-terminal domain-containing protein [Lactobacillus sp. ESL0684]|uniref:NUDIX hydrolase n=1 Tax=Lactobacillus sp. ESL0684 TaxID=2983213 RepID=UPI0023F75E0D|nr:NUDIX hydrolase N-terminal domain-containing protein [Lactobacillus sp. ESL0684]WEV42810.1 NUDIX hydrolase N-terminal domain-containing protein [Lactobacillus sp. ESL0684]